MKKKKLCTRRSLPMATFSKPVQSSNKEPELPAKRKRTLNPKITDKNNVHEDTIKRRKLAQPAHPTQPTTSSAKQRSCQPSVEEVDDEDHTSHNAGQPRNPNAILEAANGSDDFFPRLPSEEREDKHEAQDKGGDSEGEGCPLQEETDEQELGNLKNMSRTL